MLELFIFFDIILETRLFFLQSGTDTTLVVLLLTFRTLVVASRLVVMVVEMSFEEAFLVLGILLDGLPVV